MWKRFIFIVTIFLLISGCEKDKNIEPKKIKDIAYDVDKNFGYTVYIEENSTFVPYLVLTDNYDGETLLLRKYILDKARIFNENFRNSGYYENSHIDLYLNKEFINRFKPNMQENIAYSEIEITDKSSLYAAGKDTRKIKRQLFLLSYNEVGLPKESVAAIEGEVLKYFNEDNSQIAHFKTGQASGWWLRTSYTIYDTTAWSIGYDGTVGDVGVYYENGIRPAFCIDGNSKIIERKDIIKGETVYALE